MTSTNPATQIRYRPNLTPTQKKDLIDKIFKPDSFYKHCIYCGTIWDGEYQYKLYQNGTGPIPVELFGEFKISTGVDLSPECQCRYQKQLEEIRRYRANS